MAEESPDKPDLSSAFEEAGTQGYADIEINGQHFTVVKPGVNAQDGKLVFHNYEHFVSPPKSRAAYSDRTAWVMAVLSELVYIPFETGDEHKGRLLKSLAEGGFKKTEFFTRDDGTQAMLTTRPGEFSVLAFRGTEKDRHDILKDLDARFYDTADGKAHRGFVTAFEGMETSIRSALEELDKAHPGMPLFITGHSLGGAVAAAATQDLEEEHLVAACYTFGSPRIGTAEWSESVKSPMYRVVNGADGVPLVPFSGITKTIILWVFNIPVLHVAKPYVEKFFNKGFAGFQHTGDMRFIVDGDPPRLRGGSAAAWARFMHVFVGTLSRGFFALGSLVGIKALSAFFADHSISRYAAILKQIAKDRNQ